MTRDRYVWGEEDIDILSSPEEEGEEQEKKEGNTKETLPQVKPSPFRDRKSKKDI